MIICRKMQESDVSKIADIEEENFSIPWSEISLLKEVNNENSLFVVAEFEGNIAGYAGMYLIGAEGDITNVVVSYIYRRNGIASAIIEYIVEYAKSVGITDLTLEVRAGNTAAIKLYEKYGFESEGIRPGFYDFPKEDALIMWLRNI